MLFPTTIFSIVYKDVAAYTVSLALTQTNKWYFVWKVKEKRACSYDPVSLNLYQNILSAENAVAML